MDLSHNFPSLCFELRIIQAKNMDCVKSSRNSLFARFYVPTGNSNNKIQLNTKKVSSKSITPFWNESFNLECSCPQEFFETLEQESMVLELRQRKKSIWGSHLIGKGLIPWKKILDSSNMMLKEWVKMDLVDGNDDMHKAPEVEVEIKIRVRSMENEENNLNKWNKCVYKNGHDIHPWLSAEDYDIFTLGAALEAF